VAAQPRTGAGPLQAQQLQPRRAGRGVETAAEVGLAQCGTADLAARGFQHRVRRGEDHRVRGEIELGHRRGDDLALQAVAGAGIVDGGLGDDDQALFAAVGADSEHRDTALAHSGQRADRLLEVVGIEVAAGADDHLLGAPGDIEFAVGKVGVVAGDEPAVVEQRCACRRVAVIAGGRRRAAELQVADLALGEDMAGAIDDAHFMTG